MPRPQVENPSRSTLWMRERRAKARERGETLPSENWWKQNREAHRENVRKWRRENLERSKAVDRDIQKRRRSTPWGAITNCMWPLMHGGVRRRSSRWGKYNKSLGYTWLMLRDHIEKQFTAEMTWENWGSVWEIDHIRPLSAFKYLSIDDPLFREAWALTNLRPLRKEDNVQKGARIETIV